MKKTHFFTAVPLLSSLLFLTCKTPTASRPPVVQAGPKYHFEEEKLPSANPCALCVGFSATSTYRRGNITWNLCTSEQKKGYLDLKLSRANRRFNIRLFRDCSNPGSIKVIDCPTPNNEGFSDFLIKIVPSDGSGTESDLFINDNIESEQVLAVHIKSTNQVEIKLNAGWTLRYGTSFCTAGGN